MPSFERIAAFRVRSLPMPVAKIPWSGRRSAHGSAVKMLFIRQTWAAPGVSKVLSQPGSMRHIWFWP